MKRMDTVYLSLEYDVRKSRAVLKDTSHRINDLMKDIKEALPLICLRHTSESK